MNARESMPTREPSTACGTVVIGLGNRFGGDDAIGPVAVAGVAARLPDVDVVEGAADALGIVAAWEGYERVIVVDAACGDASPGTVHRFTSDAAISPKALARCSSHGGGLAEALALAHAMNRQPASLTIFAIEAASFDPGSQLTEAVQTALQPLIDQVVDEVTEGMSAEDSVPTRG